MITEWWLPFLFPLSHAGGHLAVCGMVARFLRRCTGALQCTGAQLAGALNRYFDDARVEAALAAVGARGGAVVGR